MENLFNSVNREAEERNMITRREKKRRKRKSFRWLCRNVKDLFYLLISTCPDTRMAGIKNFLKQLRLSAAACRLIHEKLIFLVAREFTRHRESWEKVCRNFILRLNSHSLPLNAKNTMFFFRYSSSYYPQKDIYYDITISLVIASGT